MPRRKKSLEKVVDKSGRLDCLLFGVGNVLTKKLEDKLGIAGLSEACRPLLQDEIQKHVRSNKVVDDKFKPLMEMVGRHVIS